MIKRFYPRGNEHNRQRALLLVNEGNFLIETLRYRKCIDTRTKRKRIVFEVKCIPSQKTKVASANIEKQVESEGYMSYLCFNCDENENDGIKNVLSYPNSCCGCYDGRTMCSHLLGKMALFSLIQTVGTNKQEFEKFLPEPPHERQGYMVPIENCCRKDGYSRSKSQRKRHRKE